MTAARGSCWRRSGEPGWRCADATSASQPARCWASACCLRRRCLPVASSPAAPSALDDRPPCRRGKFTFGGPEWSSVSSGWVHACRGGRPDAAVPLSPAGRDTRAQAALLPHQKLGSRLGECGAPAVYSSRAVPRCDRTSPPIPPGRCCRAKDLISRLLVLDPARRLTIQQVSPACPEEARARGPACRAHLLAHVPPTLLLCAGMCPPAGPQVLAHPWLGEEAAAAGAEAVQSGARLSIDAQRLPGPHLARETSPTRSTLVNQLLEGLKEVRSGTSRVGRCQGRQRGCRPSCRRLLRPVPPAACACRIEAPVGLRVRQAPAGDSCFPAPPLTDRFDRTAYLANQPPAARGEPPHKILAVCAVLWVVLKHRQLKCGTTVVESGRACRACCAVPERAARAPQQLKEGTRGRRAAFPALPTPTRAHP